MTDLIMQRPSAGPWRRGGSSSRAGLRGSTVPRRGSRAALNPVPQPATPPKRQRPDDDEDDSPPKAQKVDKGSTPGRLKPSTQQRPVQPPPIYTGRAELMGTNPRGRVTYSTRYMKHRKNEFQPGTIIRARHYEEHFDQTPLAPTTKWPTDHSRFAGPEGAVSLKQRVMIIVHCFEDHYVALPLFTHSGNGLAWMTNEQKNQYLSVCDHRAERKFVRQNSLTVLKTEFMATGMQEIHPKSTVHFTFPISIQHKLEVVIEGHLRRDSTIMLQNFYYHHIGRPFGPTNKALLEKAKEQELERVQELEQQKQQTAAAGAFPSPPRRSWASIVGQTK